MNPTVEEIVKQWLEANGYGGLYDEECGCSLDDLMPCGGEFAYRCRAGYVAKGEPGGGFDFIVGPDADERTSTAECQQSRLE